MKLPAALSALNNPDYRLLWFGAIGAFTGTQMFFLARGYVAYELTGSAAVLGVVTLAQGLPMLFLSLFGGVIADRVPRRGLLWVSQTVLCAIALAAAVLSQTGLINVWHLVVLGLLQGAVFSFNGPARQAYMIELISPEELPKAIALFNSTPMSVRIIAPSLAGALIAVPFIGTEYIFYFVFVSYLLPHLMLLRIKTPGRQIEKKSTPLLADLAAGVTYVWNHEVLKILVVAAVVPTLLGNSYNNLLPVFASDEVLGVGASGLGLLSTFAGVGAIAGSMIIASFSRIPRRGLLQLLSGVGLGAGLVLFGLTRSLPPALVALAFVGLCGSMFQTLNSTMIMSVAEPEYYGRMASLQQFNFSLVNIAVLPIGYVVDQTSAPSVTVVSGILIIAFWLLIGLFVKGYGRLESITPRASPQQAR